MSNSSNKGTPVGSDSTVMLDSRKAAVIEAIVTEYIRTGQPVGSQHVSRETGIKVSPATIRAEMAELEGDGYLIQPHTSAGRIPTDKGYRFFVNNLGPGVLAAPKQKQVKNFFTHIHGEMEELLEKTSGLLADVTSHAAVIVGPSHQTQLVRSIQIVGLGPRVALLVIVLADGALEKRTLEFDEDVSEEDLSEVGVTLHECLLGKTVGRVEDKFQKLSPLGSSVMQSAMNALGDIASEDEADAVYVGGPSHLVHAFEAVDTVRAVLSTLEQQFVMVTLLRDVIDRGLSVAIGQEHGFAPLSSCAVVVSPIHVDGQETGAVGLLGPTRMDYAQAIAAAHVVSKGLGDHLEHSKSLSPTQFRGKRAGTSPLHSVPRTVVTKRLHPSSALFEDED